MPAWGSWYRWSTRAVLNEDDRRLDAVHGIAEAEQIFGQIGAILPGDAGKESNTPFFILNSHLHSNNAPGLPEEKQFNAD